MTQKEVLRKLIELLKDELNAFDFKASYKEQGFIRQTSNAVFLYQFLVYNRTTVKSGEKGFLIEPYIWINAKPIEKYYKKITTNTVIKSETDFKTIGNSIAEIIANPDGIYKERNKSLDLHVFEEQHIPLVAEQLVKAFKTVALPYCLNNSEVSVIDKIINSKPEEYKVHMQNDNFRVIKGLIAAKINNNPNLNNIQEIYEAQIIDRDMYNAKEEWERLKEILPSIN